MELLQVLTANVRLAALVEELRMEIDQESLEWAQTNTRMHLCCHNQHEARRDTLNPRLRESDADQDAEGEIARPLSYLRVSSQPDR